MSGLLNLSSGPLFASRKSTVAQRNAVLRLAATASEQRLDFTDLLEAWAPEEKRGQRWRLRQLAATLRDGVPLAEAFERHPDVLGDEGNLLVRFGIESGTLGKLLRERVAEPLELHDSAETRLRQATHYGLMLLLLFVPIALYIQVFLVPSVRSIWAEFDLEVPRELGASASAAGVAGWVFFAVALVFVLTKWSRSLGWPARVFRRSIAPTLYSPLRSQRIGEVLSLLGNAAGSGRPIDGAVSTLARYHYDPAIRRQLLLIRNEMALGVEPWQAAQEARFLTQPESVAAVAAVHVDALGWTLKALGDRRRRRAAAVLQGIAAFALPAIVLGFGVFVLSQSLGMFAPLVRLIEALI